MVPKGGGGAGRRALHPCGSAPGLPSLPRAFLPSRLGLRTLLRLAPLSGKQVALLRFAPGELVLLPLEQTFVLRAPLAIGGRGLLLPELTRLAPAHRVSSGDLPGAAITRSVPTPANGCGALPQDQLAR